MRGVSRKIDTLSRRDVMLVGGGALMAQAVAASTACAGPETAAPIDPDPVGDAAKASMDGHAGHHAVPADRIALAAAIDGCDAAGAACIQHCIHLLAGGDTSMAACAQAVHEMLDVCRATRTLALANSDLLPDAAGLCKKACSACKTACEPHGGMHATCKACVEACAATLDALSKLA